MLEQKLEAMGETPPKPETEESIADARSTEEWRKYHLDIVNKHIEDLTKRLAAIKAKKDATNAEA